MEAYLVDPYFGVTLSNKHGALWYN